MVIFFDVDNTLLDNDQVVADLRLHLDHVAGHQCTARYWEIFEELRTRVGYADYLGALQAFRVENPREADFMKVSYFLLTYPFEARLFPGALEAVERMSAFGTTAILSDGDVVFQPWKIERSGIGDAVDGRVLIQIHKEQELDYVEECFPSDRYMLIDDKLRLLHECKKVWGERLITVFPRQGHYAHDPKILATYPPADITIDHIADLTSLDVGHFR
ncbi:MAG TPA: HAD family hydrolase [Fimbriimonadaceae bacterium]|nr:HAD family hydrolase [Fimbriimonadaceae bacterium]